MFDILRNITKDSLWEKFSYKIILHIVIEIFITNQDIEYSVYTRKSNPEEWVLVKYKFAFIKDESWSFLGFCKLI